MCRGGTGRRKHCRNLGFHVPTFFQVLGKLCEQLKRAAIQWECMHLVTCRACTQKKWVH